jgi:hypothetical protein
MSNLYSAAYLRTNPTYHQEDSLFKWNNFYKLLTSLSHFDLSRSYTLAEFGCGAGAILKQAYSSDLQFKYICGFDINPHALELCRKSLPHIHFQSDIYASDDFFDFIIISDVLEHLSDPLLTLRDLSSRCHYFLLNIPLELSLSSLLNPSLLYDSYLKVGHIHFFNYASAMALVRMAKLTVINSHLARNYLHNFSTNPSFKSLIKMCLASSFSLLPASLSSSIFGDSLVLLCSTSDNAN